MNVEREGGAWIPRYVFGPLVLVQTRTAGPNRARARGMSSTGGSGHQKSKHGSTHAQGRCHRSTSMLIASLHDYCTLSSLRRASLAQCSYAIPFRATTLTETPIWRTVIDRQVRILYIGASLYQATIKDSLSSLFDPFTGLALVHNVISASHPQTLLKLLFVL